MIPATLVGGWKTGEEGAGSQESYTIKPGLPGSQSLIEPPGVRLEQAPQSYHSFRGEEAGVFIFPRSLVVDGGLLQGLGRRFPVLGAS